jgi:hypothetical protein
MSEYRFRLSRNGLGLGFETKPVLFIGINPSTADDDNDDASVRKMTGFTTRWGFSRFLLGNVFPYRATDVKALKQWSCERGVENHSYINSMLAECAFVVPCWGARGKIPRHLWPYLYMMRTLLRLSDRPVRVLGLTQSGDPMHPLMLPYDTQLQEWTGL